MLEVFAHRGGLGRVQNVPHTVKECRGRGLIDNMFVAVLVDLPHNRVTDLELAIRGEHLSELVTAAPKAG